MTAAPTFPMLVGGRLRRAAAGRGRPVADDSGAVAGFATEATAADVADAVAAARAALPGWSGLPADERGRILFAVAELLDGHAELDADRWLWYAGWADKLPEVVGTARAGGGGAAWSAPRPVGVVGALVPSPRGLVEALAPALAAGATAVVVAPHGQPRAAGLLAELLVGSELPAGAANVLTGDLPALGPALARADVDGFDPGDDAGDAMAVAAARGAGVLRVGTADPGVARLRAWTTTAAVWHPAGS